MCANSDLAAAAAANEAMDRMDQRAKLGLGRLGFEFQGIESTFASSRIGTWVPDDCAPDLGVFHIGTARSRMWLHPKLALPPCKPCNGLASAAR